MNYYDDKESNELIRLKALANADLDSMNGFIQGGDDEFSKNNTDQENNTITFSLYNPTTSPLNVQLYGFDPANFSTTPANPPPSIPSVFGTSSNFPTASSDSFCIPNNTIYVSHTLTDTVDVIDCNTNTIITTIALPIGFTPVLPCYCPVNNQVYVGSAGFLQAIRIDCNTNTIVGPPIITSGFFSGDQPVVYNSVKNTIYAMSSTVPSQIIEISCASNLEVAFFTSILFPLLTQIGCISFNPIFNRIYINDDVGFNLFVIDCVTNTVLSVIPLPISPNVTFIGNVYCSFNNSIYIISSATDQYVRFDCATSVVSAPASTTLVATSSMAYNSINNLVYMVGFGQRVELDVTTNTLSLPIGVPISPTRYLCYNQNNNKLFGFSVIAAAYVISPLFAPTVTINLPGGITPAMIYNDTQTKPFLIRGVRIITDNFNQWNNNITFSNNSYTGAKDSKQWQPLNYISPTNPNTLLLDAPDFVLDVDRGPDSTALDFKVEPLTNVILLFTVGRTLDSSTILSGQNKEEIDNTTAIRNTGNPIADIVLGKMTKEEINAQESKYSNIEYANYPRETGNPIADIALLREYGIQGI